MKLQLQVYMLVAIILLLLIQNRYVSEYSAVNVYNDMRGGTQRINPMTGFLQESEADMKTLQPYFQGPGYSPTGEDSIRKYMFQEAPDEYDTTKPPTFSYGEPKDDFDYSKSATYDYSTDITRFSDVKENVQCVDPRGCETQPALPKEAPSSVESPVRM